MKRRHNFCLQALNVLSGLILIVGIMLSVPVKANPLDLATIPLANSPTIQIQPNLLYILDDSGSMAWNYMPDWANSSNDALLRNSSYNTIYYNPAVRYLPPANFSSSGLDTTTYVSQTGMATNGGADFSSKPNWRAVKRNAYTSNTTDNITNDAYFYTVKPGEYCTRADLKNCVAQSAPTATYSFPAPFRWCNNSSNAAMASPAVNTCQAARLSGFTNPRMPSQRVAVISITKSSNSTTIDDISINGKKILPSSAGSSANESTFASRVKSAINTCTYSVTGNCTTNGYFADTNGSDLYIYSPEATATTIKPVISSTGTLNYSAGFFAKGTAVPGDLLFTSITASLPSASYGYLGASTKASARTDCAGSTCTYAEEMTNYANWYAYYQTRTQMMKTATSLAFKDIGDDFRVGFMTTSTLGSRSLDFKTFSTANKATWYAKLFSTASDRNTPLRGTLSTAGRIYANKTSAHGTFNDPVQYECQQNFSLLTTDGFWNTADETSTYAGGPQGLTGSNVGNLDSAALGTPPGMREGTPAVSNTLADVAKYYRDTDLRTSDLGNCTGALGTNVCQTASTSTTPPNQKQTMVTLTLGLGVDGTLAYSTDYATAGSGDYYDIVHGTKNWSDPIANTDAERIDDLWHAAVNGGGTYFSAKNPTDVVSQLQQAVASIKVKVGAGTAAATSTLNPVSGDNYAYVASYTSGYWTGNLERRTIDVVTGEVSKSATHCVEDVVVSNSCASPSSVVADGTGGYNCVTPNVSDAASCAGTLVGTDCRVPVTASCVGTLKNKVSAFSSTARNIKMNVGGVLADFSYSNLSAAQKATFSPSFLAANLTQWPSLTTAQQANVTGTNLVQYLRGETGYDQSSSTEDYRVFRKRQATLGDLVDSKPAYIGTPTFNYGDPGYQAFKAAQASRVKNVYVGSNDGMLHAFNADTLDERWAYVPSMVVPNMWKLADTNYSAKHSYFVDGDITISDICTANCTSSSATWRTILVGGLNAGGRGYYALDITSPTAPSLLWEFDASNTVNGDPNLGFTFGNPVVTKRNVDGKWVVLFASGYNNVPDNSSFYSASGTKFKPNNPAIYTTGNGVGYLYEINAATGAVEGRISTGVGDTTTPSGLAKIKAYADDSEKNNATTYVYGGDLLGNVWRFNIDAGTVLKFAKLQAGAVAQPITTPPELGSINNKRVVIVGTGKYLEVADLSDTSQQTLYAIKDDSAATTLVNPRSTLVGQTIVPDGADTRKNGTAAAVNFSTGNGWYLDFPDSGERQNIASRLVLGTLLVPTTVPTSSACQPAGYGWFNYLDYRTGLAVVTTPGSSVVSQRTTAPSVGFNVVYIDGKPKVSNVVADDQNPKLIPDIPFAGSGTGFQMKRSIWREIID